MIFVSPVATVTVCPLSTFKLFLSSLSSSDSLVSESKLFRGILIRIVFESFLRATFSSSSLLEVSSVSSTLSESLAPGSNCVPEKIPGWLAREAEYVELKWWTGGTETLESVLEHSSALSTSESTIFFSGPVCVCPPSGSLSELLLSESSLPSATPPTSFPSSWLPPLTSSSPLSESLLTCSTRYNKIMW